MKELVECPNCGKQNKMNAKFCENCGTDLSNVNSTSKPEKSKNASGGIMDHWNKRSTKGKAAIGIIGLCCIGVILMVAISGLMAPDKTTTTPYSSVSNNSSSSSSTPSNTTTSDSTPAAPAQDDTGVKVQVSYAGSWQGSYGDISGLQSVDGSGTKTFTLEGNPSIVSATFQKMSGGSGKLTVSIIKDGKVLVTKSTTAKYGVVSASTSV